MTKLNRGFLRAARRKMHLSTEQAGAAIGKQRSAIWRYESGTSEMTVIDLCRLLDLYHIKPQDVFVQAQEVAHAVRV